MTRIMFGHNLRESCNEGAGMLMQDRNLTRAILALDAEHQLLVLSYDLL